MTNGLYPEFKRTGENSYELEGVYVTDADGNIKEGPYQYDGKILGSKYSNVRQSQWSTFDEWDILNGHLYHFDSTPYDLHSTKWPKSDHKRCHCNN